MSDLKQNQVLSFDNGLLTVKVSGHGQANGWATLAFKEDQFELDADGYQVVEIAPSELRELRDFLNRRLIPGNPPDRIEALEAALLDISSQKTTDEMDEEDINRADFEGAYDIIVGMARAALAPEQDK